MSKKKDATKQAQAGNEPSITNGKAKQSCVGITLNEAEIAALAHRLWLERGRPEGSPEEDWFLAERQLRHQA